MGFLSMGDNMIRYINAGGDEKDGLQVPLEERLDRAPCSHSWEQ
jgi:hypothetical protein